jgi:hypothetical protein
MVSIMSDAPVTEPSLPPQRRSRWAWSEPRRRRAAALVLLLGAWLTLLGAQHALREHARHGVWFQRWSSEHLMQTVSLVDLQRDPFGSLARLHVQPPGLDAIRSALTFGLEAREPRRLLESVDRRLLVLWALVYASTAALLFYWLASLGASGLGLAIAAIFCLHPAAIFAATLLESTALTALGILWLHFELWRFARGRGSPARLAASVVLLFLVRSIFQWPFMLVVLGCLALLRVSRRQMAQFALLAGLVVGGYLVKQSLQFGLTYTSSFAGYNCARGVGLTPPQFVPAPMRDDLHPVLGRDFKLTGVPNYNQLAYLDYNREQLAACAEALRTRSVSALLASYAENLSIYLGPSSRYTAHALVDRLPWRTAFDGVFHGLPLLILIGIAVASAALRCAKQRSTGSDPDAWRKLAALGLPSLFVATLSVVFEKGENMRFKFFLEPTLLLFLGVQLHGLGALMQRLARHDGLAVLRRSRP